MRSLPHRSGLLALALVLSCGPALAATPGDEVPADQVALLSVLRRPQTAADRSGPVRRILKLLPAHEATRVHLDAVRVLGKRAGGTTILVPMTRFGSQRDVLCLLSGGYTKLSGKRLFGVGGHCGTLADLKAGSISWPGPPFGLVPDGVAKVRLRIRGGKTITAPVHGNVYNVDEAGVFAIQPAHWLDAGGHPIRKG